MLKTGARRLFFSGHGVVSQDAFTTFEFPITKTYNKILQLFITNPII